MSCDVLCWLVGPVAELPSRRSFLLSAPSHTLLLASLTTDRRSPLLHSILDS
jgi:hypothetical protein